MQRKPDVVGLLLGAVIVAAVLFVWLYGGGSRQGGVAILRTEEVARQLGRDVVSEKAYEEKKTVMQADVLRQRELLQADIDDKRKGHGDDPTAEQQENLLAMEQQMQAQISQLARQVQKDLQQFRTQLFQDFRNELEPVIMKIAATHRFTVVLDPSINNIFFFDRAIDITDAVVKELQLQSLDATLKAPATTTSEPPLVAPGGYPVAPDLNDD